MASSIGYGPELLLFLHWLRLPPGLAAEAPRRWLSCGALLLQHAIRLLPPQWLRYFLAALEPSRFALAPRRGAACRRAAWPRRRKGGA